MLCNLEGSSQAPGRHTRGDAARERIVCAGVNGRTSSARLRTASAWKFTGEGDEHSSAFAEPNQALS